MGAETASVEKADKPWLMVQNYGDSALNSSASMLGM